MAAMLLYCAWFVVLWMVWIVWRLQKMNIFDAIGLSILFFASWIVWKVTK